MLLDILHVIQAVAVSGAAVTGAIVAVWGVRSWRAQMRGKTEYEVARRCLRHTYRVRDSLRSLRSQWMSSGEQAHALQQKDGEDVPANDDDRRQQGQVAAYEERWRRVTDAHSDLRVDLLEAEVLWPEVRQAAEPLAKCVHYLSVDLMFYVRDLSSRRPTPRLSAKHREKVERAVFWQGTDDPFEAELAAAVGELEKLLAPHVRS